MGLAFAKYYFAMEPREIQVGPIWIGETKKWFFVQPTSKRKCQLFFRPTINSLVIG